MSLPATRNPATRNPATRHAVRILVCCGALALPVVLGGCISVFPKAEPVQLYRLGGAPAAPPAPAAPAAAAAAPAAAPVAVFKGPISFPPASGGDRILTVSGSQSAYVGGARWVAPAASLFNQALLEAFDAPGAPRLVARGEPLPAASTLRLDVRTFEADYPGPTVRVQVRATLTRNADRALIGQKMFDAQVPAADNRQGPIVAAFGQAVGQVLAGVRDWTAATAPAG